MHFPTLCTPQLGLVRRALREDRCAEWCHPSREAYPSHRREDSAGELWQVLGGVGGGPGGVPPWWHTTHLAFLGCYCWERGSSLKLLKHGKTFTRAAQCVVWIRRFCQQHNMCEQLLLCCVFLWCFLWLPAWILAFADRWDVWLPAIEDMATAPKERTHYNGAERINSRLTAASAFCLERSYLLGAFGMKHASIHKFSSPCALWATSAPCYFAASLFHCTVLGPQRALEASEYSRTGFEVWSRFLHIDEPPLNQTLPRAVGHSCAALRVLSPWRLRKHWSCVAVICLTNPLHPLADSGLLHEPFCEKKSISVRVCVCDVITECVCAQLSASLTSSSSPDIVFEWLKSSQITWVYLGCVPRTISSHSTHYTISRL